MLFGRCSTIIFLALVLWQNIKIICSNYDTLAQVSYSCHNIHFLQWCGYCHRKGYIDWVKPHNCQTQIWKCWMSCVTFCVKSIQFSLCIYCNEDSECGFKILCAKEILARIAHNSKLMVGGIFCVLQKASIVSITTYC